MLNVAEAGTWPLTKRAPTRTTKVAWLGWLITLSKNSTAGYCKIAGKAPGEVFICSCIQGVINNEKLQMPHETRSGEYDG